MLTAKLKFKFIKNGTSETIVLVYHGSTLDEINGYARDYVDRMNGKGYLLRENEVVSLQKGTPPPIVDD